MQYGSFVWFVSATVAAQIYTEFFIYYKEQVQPYHVLGTGLGT